MCAGQFAQLLVNIRKMKYILGQKLGMSQMFDKNGKLLAVKEGKRKESVSIVKHVKHINQFDFATLLL